MLEVFINRESVISHKYRLSGISIKYRSYLNLPHKEQVIFESRIMNMSPAQYLRYLRDNGAKIGKVANSYLTYYFEDSKLLDKHLADLNNRLLGILTKTE